MADSQRSRIRWILIGWIFLLSAVGYLDRVNLSIAGGAIMREFSLDKVQLGWVQSAFVLGYAFFQAPAGRLADRIGPRKIISWGVVWWGVFTVLITVVPPAAAALWMVIGIRFGLGMGEAVVYPASNTIVAAWIPSTERGVANGLIFMGVGFGAGVTSPLINYIVTQHSWRAAFWTSAVIGLAAGGVWYWISRDNPKQHPWVSASEAAYIEAGLPPAEPGSHGGKLGWSQIFGNKDILFVTFSYFTYGYAAYIFFSWFFIYLSDVRGLNLKQSALWTMLPFMAMAAGSLGGGWISDVITRKYGKRNGRCMVAVVGISLAAIFIAIGTQVESVQTAVIVLAAGAGALYISQSSFWSVSADIGKKSAGSVSGVMNMGGQFGGALTASLTPFIGKHLGWNTSFLVAAALCACGAAAWFFVNPGYDSRRDKDERAIAA
ncbi:MAG TPA: MFS transporter [Bryobacteraceae bacterium]|nr:MFS transporter [Bryobacteraceae bacterium]